MYKPLSKIWKIFLKFVIKYFSILVINCTWTYRRVNYIVLYLLLLNYNLQGMYLSTNVVQSVLIHAIIHLWMSSIFIIHEAHSPWVVDILQMCIYRLRSLSNPATDRFETESVWICTWAICACSLLSAVFVLQ
jgi:hypothetical protein